MSCLYSLSSCSWVSPFSQMSRVIPLRGKAPASTVWLTYAKSSKFCTLLPTLLSTVPSVTATWFVARSAMSEFFCYSWRLSMVLNFSSSVVIKSKTAVRGQRGLTRNLLNRELNFFCMLLKATWLSSWVVSLSYVSFVSYRFEMACPVCSRCPGTLCEDTDCE